MGGHVALMGEGRRGAYRFGGQAVEYQGKMQSG